MSERQTVVVPDIGEFDDVEIIELLVAPGERVEFDQSLITLESDKASMEVPSSHGGVVAELLVAVGDRVSSGTPVLVLDPADSDSPTEDAPSATIAQAVPEAAAPAAKTAVAASASAAEAGSRSQLIVLGSGPGGYTAAFRAADLGLDVILVERYASLGGVCLNVGCIPSKALLHTAAVINEAAEMADHGVTFGAPVIDLPKLAGFKRKVVSTLTDGLAGLAKRRKVRVVQGVGSFVDSHTLEVKSSDGETQRIAFEHAIIAAGSRSARIPGLPYEDSRLMDSTGALELEDVPARLLVIGGGIIGLEMATVYDALGSKVTIVELTGELITGADRDLVKPLEKRMRGNFEQVLLDTKVVAIEVGDEGLLARFEGKNAPEEGLFDRVLLAVGRSPNGGMIGAEAAGVAVDAHGFIAVDKQMRTNVSHIFAIGDIVGQPMLAHKATHEGKVAAEVIAGHKASFDARVIPSVAYTEPELAWVGLTETEAKAQGIKYEKGSFPWAASGRALSMGHGEGLTKLLFDPETGRILGAGIVGINAGELIAEAVLAIEMGADGEDIGLTIHPHPTLSETVNFAAEMHAGTITDLYIPKRK